MPFSSLLEGSQVEKWRDPTPQCFATCWSSCSSSGNNSQLDNNGVTHKVVKWIAWDDVYKAQYHFRKTCSCLASDLTTLELSTTLFWKPPVGSSLCGCSFLVTFTQQILNESVVPFNAWGYTDVKSDSAPDLLAFLTSALIKTCFYRESALRSPRLLMKLFSFSWTVYFKSV